MGEYQLSETGYDDLIQCLGDQDCHYFSILIQAPPGDDNNLPGIYTLDHDDNRNFISTELIPFEDIQSFLFDEEGNLIDSQEFERRMGWLEEQIDAGVEAIDIEEFYALPDPQTVQFFDFLTADGITIGDMTPEQFQNFIENAEAYGLTELDNGTGTLDIPETQERLAAFLGNVQFAVIDGEIHPIPRSNPQVGLILDGMFGDEYRGGDTPPNQEMIEDFVAMLNELEPGSPEFQNFLTSMTPWIESDRAYLDAFLVDAFLDNEYVQNNLSPAHLTASLEFIEGLDGERTVTDIATDDQYIADDVSHETAATLYEGPLEDVSEDDRVVIEDIDNPEEIDPDAVEFEEFQTDDVVEAQTEQEQGRTDEELVELITSGEDLDGLEPPLTAEERRRLDQLEREVDAIDPDSYDTPEDFLSLVMDIINDIFFDDNPRSADEIGLTTRNMGNIPGADDHVAALDARQAEIDFQNTPQGDFSPHAMEQMLLQNLMDHYGVDRLDELPEHGQRICMRITGDDPSGRNVDYSSPEAFCATFDQYLIGNGWAHPETLIGRENMVFADHHPDGYVATYIMGAQSELGQQMRAIHGGDIDLSSLTGVTCSDVTGDLASPANVSGCETVRTTYLD